MTLVALFPRIYLKIIQYSTSKKCEKNHLPLVSDDDSTDLDVDCFGTNSGAELQDEDPGVQGEASGFSDNFFIA